MPSLSPDEFNERWSSYNDSFEEPLSKNLWASDGFWRLVGNGEKKDESCGRFVGFNGCRSPLHDFTTLAGESFKNQVFVTLKHKSCFRYDCPICYLSWAVHEAHAITDKLEFLNGKFGTVKHIVVSLPSIHSDDDEKTVKLKGKWVFRSDMGKAEFDKLVVRVTKALKRRGVVGGSLIFHGFRYNDFDEAKSKGVEMGWYWSPHFHYIGFLEHQKQFFRVCEHEYYNDLLVVKLQEERKTVFGTAWYQLNHAAVLTNVKKFVVVRWFGVCRGVKVPKVKHDSLCPICQSKVVKLLYFGRKDLKKNLLQCTSKDKRFLTELNEGQGEVWVEDTSHNCLRDRFKKKR